MSKKPRPYRIVYDGEWETLSPYSNMLFLAIQKHCRGRVEDWSPKAIGALIGMSRQYVHRHVRELVENGLVTVEGGKVWVREADDDGVRVADSATERVREADSGEPIVRVADSTTVREADSTVREADSLIGREGRREKGEENPPPTPVESGEGFDIDPSFLADAPRASREMPGAGWDLTPLARRAALAIRDAMGDSAWPGWTQQSRRRIETRLRSILTGTDIQPESLGRSWVRYCKAYQAVRDSLKHDPDSYYLSAATRFQSFLAEHDSLAALADEWSRPGSTAASVEEAPVQGGIPFRNPAVPAASLATLKRLHGK